MPRGPPPRPRERVPWAGVLCRELSTPAGPPIAPLSRRTTGPAGPSDRAAIDARPSSCSSPKPRQCGSGHLLGCLGLAQPASKRASALSGPGQATRNPRVRMRTIDPDWTMPIGPEPAKRAIAVVRNSTAALAWR